jgi:hypothetical protein
MYEEPQDSRMPRGVLAVVAVGLIATLAAALLTAGKSEGEAAHLEFVQIGKIPDSRPVDVPGGGTMQLTEGRIQETGTNFGGYSLFRVATTLTISRGAPTSGGQILCRTSVKPQITIARSSNDLRALYPRSSEEGIWGQEVPEALLLKFSSHNSGLAVIEVGDLNQPRFTTIQGVKLEWPEFKEGLERLEYSLPDSPPPREVRLPFYTVWKTQYRPAAKVSCTLETSAGKATARTAGGLPKISPPIDEEAEEHKAEEREEEEEG